MKLRTPRPDFEQPPGVVVVPMDLTSGRRGVGPCSRVVMEAFVAGQEPDKDCNGATVAASKLPYYLQRPFYQAKEAEPTQPIACDASAQSGESAESPRRTSTKARKRRRQPRPPLRRRDLRCDRAEVEVQSPVGAFEEDVHDRGRSGWSGRSGSSEGGKAAQRAFDECPRAARLHAIIRPERTMFRTVCVLLLAAAGLFPGRGGSRPAAATATPEAGRLQHLPAARGDAPRLCSGHVTGWPAPTVIWPGPHIGWRAYSSTLSRPALAKRYFEVFGRANDAREGGCDLWRSPKDAPTDILAVCDASTKGQWDQCAPPPADANSIIEISYIVGR